LADPSADAGKPAAPKPPDAPKSLRMRPRQKPQVAQAAPDPQPAADAPPAGAPAPAPAPDQAPPPPAATPEPAPPAAAAPPAAETPNLSDEELAKLSEQNANTEVITVTGSLIGRSEVDSPSPISVVDQEKLEAAGVTNVGDILQKIPAQGNAINAQNNNGGDGSVRVNLRSLGSNRTLVLMNGRRVVPSGLGADSSVDFGTIPLAMIERVEVLKDGASAIYGSDAISGVVNVITKANFNGTEATAYTASTQKGDGTDYDLSFVTGATSAKGNIMFAAGYQKQNPVMAGDRDFSDKTYGFDYANNVAILEGSSSAAGGRINAMPNGGPPLNIPGCTPTKADPYCTSDGHGGFRSYVLPSATSFGDAYNFQPENYLLTPSQRVNLFSNGSYEITKNIQAFYEAQFNNRRSTQQLAEEPATLGAFGTPISADSIYNPLGQNITDYNRRLVEFGPRTFNQEVNTDRVVVGIKGSVAEDLPVLKNWKWEVSYDFGRTDSTQSTHGDLILSHLGNALGPSFVSPANGPECGTPTSPIPGCVPLNLLTPGNVTQAMINYLTFTGTQSGFNEQHTAQATASGRLVELPNHGDISLAVGVDYRHEQGGQEPDPLTATGDTTGNAFAPTEGAYHTFEGFSELSIVPVSGLDYLKWVEIDAAGRAFNYNTFGSGVTGKLSALVRTVDGIAVRGTVGNAFRAPNVAELFLGQADSFPSLKDPCDTHPPGQTSTVMLSPTAQKECSAQGVPMGSSFGTSQQRSRLGGNPGLQPEHAIVATVGGVYEPLPGLDFTLDYWHINITDAITALQGATILSQCYTSGVQGFCDLVQRDPVTHGISHIIDTNQNVGGLTTSGLDFSAAYQYRNELGTFRHAVEGTYLFQFNEDTGTKNADGTEDIIHGKNFYDLGVNPDLKVNVFTLWTHPSGLGGGFNFRFVDGFKECDNDDCNDSTNLRRNVSKYATGDIFLNYALKSAQGTTKISVGVNNVVNAQPPVIYDGAALNADESAYDFLGRFLYVRLGQMF